MELLVGDYFVAQFDPTHLSYICVEFGNKYVKLKQFAVFFLNFLLTVVNMLECETFTCSNRNATLKHHANSLRGSVFDFIITFAKDEFSVHDIIEIASDLFISLCERFGGNGLKGDLCAKVRYLRCTTGKEESYYHASSPSEMVTIPTQFFKEHMLRIGSRIDNMNERGSMLLITAIEEIHVRMSVLA